MTKVVIFKNNTIKVPGPGIARKKTWLGSILHGKPKSLKKRDFLGQV